MPRDGEGTPTDSDDELLAKVVPLRRRGGEPVSPRILADEPRGQSQPPEAPEAHIEWSIWDPPPDELGWREREPAGLHVLADEPGGRSDPAEERPVPAEWSMWDPSAPLPPLRKREARAAARSGGALAGGPNVLGRRSPRRLIGAVAAGTGAITAVAALALALGALKGQSGPARERASPGLQASRPSSAGLAKGAASRPRHSTAAAPGSHRRPAEDTAKATSTAPKFIPAGSGDGVPATVQYHSPAIQSPTAFATSPPAAENSPAPKGSSASASREFGFER